MDSKILHGLKEFETCKNLRLADSAFVVQPHEKGNENHCQNPDDNQHLQKTFLGPLLRSVSSDKIPFTLLNLISAPFCPELGGPALEVLDRGRILGVVEEQKRQLV